jgi:hypothetical protein
MAKSNKNYPQQKEIHLTFTTHPKRQILKDCTHEYFKRFKNVYLDDFELDIFLQYLDTTGFFLIHETYK